MIRARKVQRQWPHMQKAGAGGGTECSAFCSYATLSVQREVAYSSGGVGS